MSDTEEKPRGKPIIIRNATDLQRLKLEKLMKHPDREILIPEKPKERGMPVVPEFVRNVMGSSAGAGSGEFHVYRHLRRKEYARQKFMKEKGERERLDDEYRDKLEDNKRKCDEKTAKRRAKRLKRKEKMKTKPKAATTTEDESEDENSEAKGEDESIKQADVIKNETLKEEEIVIDDIVKAEENIKVEESIAEKETKEDNNDRNSNKSESS